MAVYTIKQELKVDYRSTYRFPEGISLSTPTDVDAIMFDFDSIDIIWTFPEEEEVLIESFEIERQTNGAGEWTAVTTVTDETLRTYRNNGLTPDTLYGYRIRAIFIEDGAGPWSDIGADATGEL